MKILWITNAAVGPLGPHIYGKEVNGAWVSALLSEFESAGEHQVVIATTAAVSMPVRLTNKKALCFMLFPIPLLSTIMRIRKAIPTIGES